MAPGVVDQDLNRIEAHRLRVDQPDRELGRVEELQERRLVGGPGEGRGVALGEAEARECRDTTEQLLGLLVGQAVGGAAAVDEALVQLLHLLAGTPRSHRPPEPVRLARGEARDRDGDVHDLFLVQDHAEGLAQDRSQAGMEILDRLEALAAAQVWMNGVALDRPRPDDRDLHDQIVQVCRARLGERLHLGPTLHLEDADRVRGLKHLEHFRDVFRQEVEVYRGGAVAFDQLERFVDRGQHAQAEQVQLDQLECLDIALVELDDHSVGHGGTLDRRDVDQRRGRHEHAAGVDAEVAREAVDAGTERQPALPVRKGGGGATARLRGRGGRHFLGREPGDARRGVARSALVFRPDRPPPRLPTLLLRGRPAAEIDRLERGRTHGRTWHSHGRTHGRTQTFFLVSMGRVVCKGGNPRSLLCSPPRPRFGRFGRSVTRRSARFGLDSPGIACF